MILWIVKLIGTVRRAIAGRKHPHQMAWAVAFGLLLGVVPHGNLLALVLLLVVLSLKINHAMAGLTAIGATLMAAKFDPYWDQVGDYVLTHPRLSEMAASAWQLPLVPWTDLNNTVVMGSFLIGVAALVPVFAVTYPVFRLLAPSLGDSDDVDSTGPSPAKSRPASESTHQVIMVDRGHQDLDPPHLAAAESDAPAIPASSDSGSETAAAGEVDFVEVDPETDEAAGDRVAVETRIDVIRMKDYLGPSEQTESGQDDSSDAQQPMDEALNYLLRQLRDSQQRKAA